MSGAETAGAAIAVLGVVTGTYAKVQQAEAEASMHGAVAKAREQEALAAEREAAQAAHREKRKVAHALGKATAAGAAAGVDITGGSPLMQELDSVRQGSLGALDIIHKGQLISTGKRFEAQLSKFQRSMAKNRRDWAYVQGVTQLGSVAAGAGGGGGGGGAGLAV